MKFWSFNNLEESAEMRLEGVISEDTWWGDEVTPKLFRDELALYAGKPLTIWINSPGGDVFAASVIYTAMKERDAPTHVKIDGMAASAASVIAMAGDTVEMSPTSIMMIHNPWTFAIGDENDLKGTINVLKEVKETIMNAYEIKTGLSREEISKMMDKETWMNATRAVQLGFADSVLYADGSQNKAAPKQWSQKKYQAQIVAKIAEMQALEEPIDELIEEPTELDQTEYINQLNYMNMEVSNERQDNE